MILIVLGFVLGTLVVSLIGLACDDEVVWEQMDWKPTYPYGFRVPEPHVDPDIVVENLFES